MTLRPFADSEKDSALSNFISRDIVLDVTSMKSFHDARARIRVITKNRVIDIDFPLEGEMRDGGENYVNDFNRGDSTAKTGPKTFL